MAVWASHGRYYDFRTDQWRWQRPGLFGTCEDILTQTIVVPFLMPMLENAGAVVFSPRERDTQTNEVIVDNDRPTIRGTYREDNGPRAWVDCGTGFAHWREFYRDKQNPFEEGTARVADAQSESSRLSTVTWIPDRPEDGEYAVYVSYKTLPTSVPDAVYNIRRGKLRVVRLACLSDLKSVFALFLSNGTTSLTSNLRPGKSLFSSVEV